CGCIRVCEGKTVEQGTEIRIEHLAKGSDAAFTVTRLSVPFQVYEGVAEHTLKTDLIADDLVVETAINLKTQSVQQCSEAVTAWAQLILWPCLQQLQTAPMKSAPHPPRPRRHRLAWKLSLDTLLLCSPFVIGRNWYRRWRSRYPVLILTHHLVSDRPHRMGMSTKIFWRQVRFLQRHYRIVSLSQAIELLHLGNVSTPTAVL